MGQIKMSLTSVLKNFIWLLGAAIILSALSWQEFIIQKEGKKRKDAWRSQQFKLPFYLGLFLITIGVCLTIQSAFMAVLMLGSSFLFLFLLFRTLTKKSSLL